MANRAALLLPLVLVAEIRSVSSLITVLWFLEFTQGQLLGRCSEFRGDPVPCRRKKWGKSTTTDGKPLLVREPGDSVGSEGDQWLQRLRSLILWLGVGMRVVNHRRDWLLSLHNVSHLSFWRQTAGLDGHWSVFAGYYFNVSIRKRVFFPPPNLLIKAIWVNLQLLLCWE